MLHASPKCLQSPSQHSGKKRFCQSSARSQRPRAEERRSGHLDGFAVLTKIDDAADYDDDSNDNERDEDTAERKGSALLRYADFADGPADDQGGRAAHKAAKAGISGLFIDLPADQNEEENGRGQRDNRRRGRGEAAEHRVPAGRLENPRRHRR